MKPYASDQLLDALAADRRAACFPMGGSGLCSTSQDDLHLRQVETESKHQGDPLCLCGEKANAALLWNISLPTTQHRSKHSLQKNRQARKGVQSRLLQWWMRKKPPWIYLSKPVPALWKGWQLLVILKWPTSPNTRTKNNQSNNKQNVCDLITLQNKLGFYQIVGFILNASPIWKYLAWSPSYRGTLGLYALLSLYQDRYLHDNHNIKAPRNH